MKMALLIGQFYRLIFIAMSYFFLQNLLCDTHIHKKLIILYFVYLKKIGGRR